MWIVNWTKKAKVALDAEQSPIFQLHDAMCKPTEFLPILVLFSFEIENYYIKVDFNLARKKPLWCKKKVLIKSERLNSIGAHIAWTYPIKKISANQKGQQFTQRKKSKHNGKITHRKKRIWKWWSDKKNKNWI